MLSPRELAEKTRRFPVEMENNGKGPEYMSTTYATSYPEQRGKGTARFGFASGKDVDDVDPTTIEKTPNGFSRNNEQALGVAFR
jgi:hypothetical protein